MSQLRIKVVAGRESGKRLKLRETEAPIGRGPGNVIRIDEPEVSRDHAKLVYDAGQWYLENISRNGTRLDGKTVTRKRRPITQPGVGSVGELPILEVVGIDHPDALPLDDEEDEDTEPAAAGLSKRGKVWIGIGAYFGLMVLLALFLQYNDSVSADDDAAAATPLVYLSKDQVAAEIRAPIEKATTPDPDEALDWITKGKEAYSKRNQALNYLYDANLMFKRAQSLVREGDVPGGSELERARNRRTIRRAEKELIETVWSEYETAMGFFDNEDYPVAADGFSRVVQRYPDTGSLIRENAERFRDRARGLAKKRRR